MAANLGIITPATAVFLAVLFSGLVIVLALAALASSSEKFRWVAVPTAVVVIAWVTTLTLLRDSVLAA